MAKKKPAAETESISFEDSLAELEQLLAKLEGGKLGLAESLSAYEQGVRRLNGCYQMLEAAERKIELVQSVDADGKTKTVPLDDAEAGDLTEKASARSRRRSASATSESVDDGTGLF